MPKNVLQDVVPPTRRSIRHIPLSHGVSAQEEVSASVHEPVRRSEESERERSRSHRDGWIKRLSRIEWSFDFSRWIIWGIGIISAAVLIFVLGNIFSGAELTVTPKTRALSVDVDLVAKPKDPKDTSQGLSYIPFALVREKETVIPADSLKAVEWQATGKIIIYNNYSTSPQRLIKNTRFETPDGLIYKIHDSVTVPGRHSVAGNMLPGSIETSVFADVAGEEYNIGLTDFTIPGFKSNAERFAGFYARSKTPMTGGKIGTVKSVSDEKLRTAKVQLENEWKAALVAETLTHKPADAVFYDGAYRVSFEELPTSAQALQDNVTIRERAHFTAFFLPSAELAEAIAANSLDVYDGAPVAVPDVPALLFDFKTKNDYGATSVGPIRFNLKGPATIVWQFDHGKLKSDLAGKTKKELPGIIASYPAIVKATATVRPFWKRVFPKSPDKIKVVTVHTDTK